MSDTDNTSDNDLDGVVEGKNNTNFEEQVQSMSDEQSALSISEYNSEEMNKENTAINISDFSLASKNQSEEEHSKDMSNNEVKGALDSRIAKLGTTINSWPQ